MPRGGPLIDDGDELLIDVIVQEALERLLVARPEGLEDERIGRLRALEKTIDVEIGIGLPDLPQGAPHASVGFQFLHRFRKARTGPQHRAIGRHPTVLQHLPRRRLLAGPASEDTAQPQRDKTGNHCQKNDVDELKPVVHAVFHDSPREAVFAPLPTIGISIAPHGVCESACRTLHSMLCRDIQPIHR